MLLVLIAGLSATAVLPSVAIISRSERETESENIQLNQHQSLDNSSYNGISQSTPQTFDPCSPVFYFHPSKEIRHVAEFTSSFLSKTSNDGPLFLNRIVSAGRKFVAAGTNYNIRFELRGVKQDWLCCAYVLRPLPQNGLIMPFEMKSSKCLINKIESKEKCKQKQ